MKCNRCHHPFFTLQILIYALIADFMKSCAQEVQVKTDLVTKLADMVSSLVWSLFDNYKTAAWHTVSVTFRNSV